LLLGGRLAGACGRARLYRIGLVVFVAQAFPGVWPSGRACVAQPHHLFRHHVGGIP